MSYITPITGRIAAASAVGATTSRNGAFLSGVEGLAEDSAASGLTPDGVPVPHPQESEFNDVGGMAKGTVKPGAIV